MLNLTFITNEEDAIHLAQLYWSLNTNGEWTFTTNELATKFSCKRTSIPTMVRRSCIARASNVVCDSCHENAMEVKSRTEYDSITSKMSPKNRWSRHFKPYQCHECMIHAAQVRDLEIQEKILNEKLIITQHVENLTKIFETKDYTNIQIKDAFLLYGILSNSDGYSDDGKLASYNSGRLFLFAHPSDTSEAYNHLYRSGWITINSSSKFSAFSVTDSKIVNFDVDSVDWLLAKDSSNIPYDQLLNLLEEVLSNATPIDLIDIWYWVCISELRKSFEEVQSRFNLREKLWKPLIEQKLKELLRVCSVGKAKAVIWLTLTSIVKTLQDTHYTKAHTYNMIPGNFLRVFQRFQADGFSLRAWHRPSIEHEAIFTGLLFDKLMGGGTNFYNELTGEELERLITGTNNSVEKHQATPPSGDKNEAI